MPLNKEQAQDLIDNFVVSNDSELNNISTENPALFDATISALDFLSKRFGTAEKTKIVEKPIVEQVVESNLPFEEGTKFIVPLDKSSKNNIYTISDINLDKGEAKISWYSNVDKIDKSYNEKIENAKDYFNGGQWVKVLDEIKEEKVIFPFEVGEQFIVNGTDLVFEIKSISTETLLVEYISDGLKVTMEKEKFLDGVRSNYYNKYIPKKSINVVQASNSGFIAKLPKKTISKEDKEIKRLQKEIDGLEVLAEFDDEVKDELEKKKKELQALKLKNS
jgi:hypothetical protein